MIDLKDKPKKEIMETLNGHDLAENEFWIKVLIVLVSRCQSLTFTLILAGRY